MSKLLGFKPNLLYKDYAPTYFVVSTELMKDQKVTGSNKRE